MATRPVAAGFTNRVPWRARPGHVQRGIMEQGGDAPGLAPAPVFTNGRRRSSIAVTATFAVNLLLSTLGSQPSTVEAALATHSYSAPAPQVRSQVAVPVATHSTTAIAPQVHAGLAAPTAAHTYSAVAPKVQAQVQPPAAAHTYTAHAPTASADIAQPFAQHHWPNPARRAVGSALVFSQPVGTTGTTVSAPTAAHAYTASVPTAGAAEKPFAQYAWSAPRRTKQSRPAPRSWRPDENVGNVVSAPVASHTYSGAAPQVKARVQPGAATHVYTGAVPASISAAPPPHKQLAWPNPPRKRQTPVTRSWRPDLAPDTMLGEPGQVRTYVQPNPQRPRRAAHLVRAVGRPAFLFPVVTTVAAPVASHAYSAPAAQVRARVQPGAVAHSYTAQIPSVTAGVAVPAVSHTYTPAAAQVKAQVRAGVAVHTYTGRLATASTGIAAPAAAQTYSVPAPQVKVQVSPAPSAHTYSGAVPRLIGTLKATLVAHAYTGPVPRLVHGVSPAPASHTYTGRVPQARQQVRAPMVAHTYTGQTPGASNRAPGSITPSVLGSSVTTLESGATISLSESGWSITLNEP